MGKIYDAMNKHNSERRKVDDYSVLKMKTALPKNGDNHSVTKAEKRVKRRKKDAGKYELKSNLSKNIKEKDSIDIEISRNLIMYHEPNSFEAEQFKALRTKLFFNKSGVRPKSIMVTSAVPGEGKTFVSTNLAVSIAQTVDEYVLLLDCDLRNPSVNGYFGLKEIEGLSDYLKKGTPLSNLMVKPLNSKLSVLTAGRATDNPSELIASKEMSALIAEITSRYSDRYLIIDSPPPNLIAEADAIAKQVDGILLVIRYGSTKRELIQDLIKKVGKEKVLGSVLNRFDLRMPTYYNGYHKVKTYKKYYKHR